MKKHLKKIGVVGDGGWGTTLAVHLAKKGLAVSIWGPFPEYLNQVEKTRINEKFLPGIRIPESISFIKDLKTILEDSDVIVLAVPSQFIVSILQNIKSTKVDLRKKILLSVIKGIETNSLLRMSQIIEKYLGKNALAILSGPTIAMEVAKGIPTTAVISSKNKQIVKPLQKIFNSQTFRIYTNTDIIGVELGGTIKNVIAIACGVCDGLGLGTNAKAAIVSRGLAEMNRLGVKMGAKKETLAGLAGLGDLVTTAFSPRSRNRTVGELLGSGKSIKEIVSKMEMVAEGVENAKAIYRLSQKYKTAMPICTETYKIIYQNKKPSQALNDLMNRQVKAE